MMGRVLCRLIFYVSSRQIQEQFHPGGSVPSIGRDSAPRNGCVSKQLGRESKPDFLRKHAIPLRAQTPVCQEAYRYGPEQTKYGEGVFVDHAIEDAAFILEPIDKKWPAIPSLTSQDLISVRSAVRCVIARRVRQDRRMVEESRMSALIFMRGFGRDSCYRMRRKRTVRYMRNLQRPYLQGFTLSC